MPTFAQPKKREKKLPDVIQLLSDHLANQIAAGEVIQRPASAVKELLENAIDAGATDIQLVIKDAGKELIQVIDNGSGMSPVDARMSFERHATSKIKSIDDLFTIRTMGFRGEALASIAAVAQVELKSKKADTALGTHISIEGTEVKFQEACSCADGTNLMVKNLFFNVPARRHFLKSNNTEYRHILDEFTRIAMAQPQVGFRLWHNGAEQFRLEPGNLKTRVVHLLAGSFEKNLVPVEEHAELLNIYGFIGKPEAATRSKGNQFFFINNRFIRSPYLHHAVSSAYEGMIARDAYPFYVLFLETDPARVDVNVHPTKQEVKFDDDRMMYAYLHAAIKHSLARFNISPALDFTLNAGVEQLSAVNRPQEDAQIAKTQSSYLYQAFQQKNQAHFADPKGSMKQWKDLYQIAQQTPESHTIPSAAAPEKTNELHQNNPIAAQSNHHLLVQGSLLVTTIKSGLMLIHIRRAQERIWYERLIEEWNAGNTASQQLLFPTTHELSPQEALLLNEVLADLLRIGFDIRPFGQHTFVVQGVPSGLAAGEEKGVMDDVIEQLKNEASDAVAHRQEKMLAQVAKRLSQNKQAILQAEGQQALIDELFACPQPEYAPDGKKIFRILKREELDGMLD